MDCRDCSPKESDQNQDVFMKTSIGSIIFDFMKKYNNRIFQYEADTDETDTYAQALKRCIRTALKLKEKGLTRDDIISTCTHNHKNSVVPYLAALFLGIKIAHFDPSLSYLDTIHLLKLMRPKILFVALESLSFMERCLKESEVDTELVVFGETKEYSKFSEYLVKHPQEDEFGPVAIENAKETAVIMFSSGTTGLPKGICLNHYGLSGQVQNKDMDCMGDGNVSLLYTTFYWISATIMLIKCITDGGSRVVCHKFDGAKTWGIIEKYKVTSLFLAPYHAKEFLASRQKNVDTSSLKYFLTGAAPVTVKLMEELREALPSAKILHGYGQTEACSFLSIFDANDPKELEMQIKKPLSCGKIPSFYTWKVVDPVTEKVLGPNERGELRYKSEYILNGYYKMDSSSAFDSEGFIKSGDIVYYDEEGCLYIVDRIKEMFKYKSWHILPALLEQVLLNHPAVKEAAVIGIPHELEGDHPMGIVVLNKGYQDVSADDIQRYMDKIVPDTQRLRAGIKIVDDIVKTTTGKIRRNVLRDMVLSGEIHT